ncbi:MAG: FUN14 domain-containing protein [Candidatus Nitrosopolaris sp.]
MKISAVIIGMFIAALAYLEYQRIIQVDWDKLQAVSQDGITMIANAITHISNNIGADHGVSTNLGASNLIPLASSTSAGLMLGLARG